MKKLTVIVSLAFSINIPSAWADSFGIRASIDGFRDKLVTVSYDVTPFENKLDFISFSPKLGMLTNGHNVYGGAPTLFGEFDINAKVKLDCGVYIKASQGISVQSKRWVDDHASVTQLPSELQLGFDDGEHYVGMFVQHFSNGTDDNNDGHNFMGLEIGLHN